MRYKNQDFKQQLLHLHFLTEEKALSTSSCTYNAIGKASSISYKVPSNDNSLMII